MQPPGLPSPENFDLAQQVASLQQSEAILTDRINDLEAGILRQTRNLRRVRVVLALCVGALSIAGLISLNSMSSKDQDMIRQQISGLITTAMIGCVGVMLNEIQKERKS
jgi:hypothetical protein